MLGDCLLAKSLTVGMLHDEGSYAWIQWLWSHPHL
jgi:hypothetical protein